MYRPLVLFCMITMIGMFTHDVCGTAPADTVHASDGVSVCYWGTMINSTGFLLDRGFMAGYENYFMQNSVFSVIGRASLLLQRKPGVYTSIGGIVENAVRITFKPGLYIEHGVNVGYMGSYYDFAIYKTDPDGKIINIGREWLNTLIVGYSGGLGYDFSRLTKTDLQVFVKPFFYLKFPNNDNLYLLHNYSIETGIAFHPKSLLLCGKKKPIL